MKTFNVADFSTPNKELNEQLKLHLIILNNIEGMPADVIKAVTKHLFLPIINLMTPELWHEFIESCDSMLIAEVADELSR